MHWSEIFGFPRNASGDTPLPVSGGDGGDVDGVAVAGRAWEEVLSRLVVFPDFRIYRKTRTHDSAIPRSKTADATGQNKAGSEFNTKSKGAFSFCGLLGTASFMITANYGNRFSK